MREIKFRIWNKIDETLQQGSWIRFVQNEKTLQVAPYEIDDIDPADCILMQYTGLKDKNGKEIYEGDICKDFLGKIYQVRWNGWAFSPYMNCLCCTDENKKNNTDDEEIIGNFYENPELLK